VTYLIDKMQRAGAQVHLAQLAARLDRSAFDAEVVCLLDGGPMAEELRGRGIAVDVLGLGRLYGPRGLAGLPRLARRLRSRPVDLLHTYLVSANVYGTLAARLARVPAVITTRRDTGFSRNWRLRLLEELFVNPVVDRVVAVSAAVADGTRLERGLKPEQVVTIENGVDMAACDPETQCGDAARRELGLRAEDLTVGVVGHLSAVKGQADFLAAAALVAAACPRARFLVVGDGPLRASLEALAVSLGIRERVVFTGARADVPRLLAALDVVVVPSHTEGMSNALLEAMAMARPVVATAVPGNRAVVRDGETGRLVAPRAPEALADAVVGLLRDRSGAERLGRAARRWVGDTLSLERMVTRYEQLYRALAAP
jgi:glycosyltransferase involved in cell wall biosynthesis